jgi:ABC-type iron transport system FetAB ATPase subunit
MPPPPPPPPAAAPPSRRHALVVSGLDCAVGGRAVHASLSFAVASGEALFVRGPSGAGKSLLLRALAGLDAPDAGRVVLDGATLEDLGAPAWRARVCYVPQSRVPHEGTPARLYVAAQKFAAQRGRPRGDLPALVHALGLEQAALHRSWASLSGGEAARAALAVAVALRPDVLLLDEPTAALDAASARRVERALKASGAALVWVSHDPAQPGRVGGRVLDLPAGIESAAATPPASPEPAAPPSLGRPAPPPRALFASPPRAEDAAQRV